MNGWMGKILSIDLTNSEITEIDTMKYAEKYLGGRGIGARIYWETVAPETGAFDLENRLIFMTGPLVGTGAQGATQLSVVSKSPMTLPEGYCYGSFGGYAGAELKKAGFDGIVISGRARKPVYIHICDGRAEIHSAAAFWGQNGYRTGEMLRQAYGSKTHYITTGISGENMVRTANLLASFDATVCAGFGGVMGSKNLKAIAIQGSGEISVADAERLKELAKYTLKLNKGLMEKFIPHRVVDTGHEHLLEVAGKSHCYKCGLECVREIYRYGKRLIGYGKCQSMEYYLPWVYSRDDEPLETFFFAPIMVNDYCLDSQEMQNMIDWLYACYLEKALTEEETGLPLSEIGTMDFLVKLFDLIIHRRGFGDALADGLVRIGNRVSGKARALFPKTVTDIGMKDMATPRMFVVNSFLYYLDPRLHQNLMHETLVALGGWIQHRLNPDASPVTPELLRRIAVAFWGSEEAADFQGYGGKSLAAVKIQNRTIMKESLGLCDFVCPTLYSYNTPDNLGDPELESKIYNAVTGRDGSELEVSSERIFNLQRAIMIREGRKTPEDDMPDEFNFTEPFSAPPDSPMAEIPGPGGEAAPVMGNILDRNKYNNMLKEYYRIRGWDENTGLFLPETLEGLGLNDIMLTFRGNLMIEKSKIRIP